MVWIVVLLIGMMVGMTPADRGIELLRRGEWNRGWELYEARPHARPLKKIIHQWNGERVNRLLVRAEQGRGDLFQFIRYLPVVAERATRVSFSCSIDLHEIFRQALPTSIQLLRSPDGEFDAVTRLMSLPLNLRLFDPCQAPQPPYITPDKVLVEKWRSALSTFTGVKVGIVWQGKKENPLDASRSVSFSLFRPLADIRGVTLISLQKHDGAEQLRGHSPPVLDAGLHLDRNEPAFCSTAAIIQNLDLVICVDTAIAHLAGAMGRPVWLALGVAPDWRWGLSGESTPWYPSMRLFRQRTLGDWGEVFTQIASELRKLS